VIVTNDSVVLIAINISDISQVTDNKDLICHERGKDREDMEYEFIRRVLSPCEALHRLQNHNIQCISLIQHLAKSSVAMSLLTSVSCLTGLFFQK